METLLDLEAFDTIRLKRRVKLALENLQEQIRQTEQLHKRPALSDVVQRLVDIATARSGERVGPAKPPGFNPRNSRHHKLLEFILESPTPGARDAILKNLRYFAYTTTVAGPKSDQELDRDLDLLIENLEKEQGRVADVKHISKKRRRLV